MYAALLPPGHQFPTRTARLGSDPNLDQWSARADLDDNAAYRFTRPRRSINVGAAQLGRQQVPPAEDVERKITVTIIVAVEEAALLVPVQRIVGGIQIENNALWRLGMRLQKQRYE